MPQRGASSPPPHRARFAVEDVRWCVSLTFHAIIGKRAHLAVEEHSPQRGDHKIELRQRRADRVAEARDRERLSARQPHAARIARFVLTPRCLSSKEDTARTTDATPHWAGRGK